jgi:NifB/MoaA-like Fe-S oxidoreductase
MLDHGIVVHGQVVVCPGVNDGVVLDDTLTGVLDRFPDLATVACVPLGVSKHSGEAGLRAHTTAEAAAVVDQVEVWQGVFASVLGRRMVWAADEYHLLAGRPFPPAQTYEGYSQHENGIGMATAFADSFGGGQTRGRGAAPTVAPHHSGFFQAVDGAPAEGYRAVRSPGTVSLRPSRRAPVAVVTGEYGAQVLRPLLPAAVRLVTVVNDFFGGTTRVAGLLTGEDVARALSAEPEGHRYLLPDVCLNEGRFLDGLTLADLPRPVEVVPADGSSLRLALGAVAEPVPA